MHGCSLQAQFGQVLVQLTREASMTAVGYFNAVQAAGQAAGPTASPAVVVPVKQVRVHSCALLCTMLCIRMHHQVVHGPCEADRLAGSCQLSARGHCLSHACGPQPCLRAASKLKRG